MYVKLCEGIQNFPLTVFLQYSTAKAAILGLTRTLSLEGQRYNILSNCVAPMAGTAMTMTIWYANKIISLTRHHQLNIRIGLRKWLTPSR